MNQEKVYAISRGNMLKSILCTAQLYFRKMNVTVFVFLRLNVFPEDFG